MKKPGTLSITGVAMMFIGTIMGAGFASGREIWQFFGVFGCHGYIGAAMTGALIIFFGVITTRIARMLSTNDIGRIIVPWENPLITDAVGYLVAIMLFFVFVTMTAAGGALLAQQFGIHRIWGGLLITVLVVITVLGDFGRVSASFRCIMPFLIIAIVLVSGFVLIRDFTPSGMTAPPQISPLAPSWWTAAPVYFADNLIALTPILATASLRAGNGKRAAIGAALGGAFLALLMLLLICVLLKEPGFSQAMDMPMLAWSSRISPAANGLFCCLLMFAIYASGTSNYYSLTTKLRPSPQKKKHIILIAAAAFAAGTVGFTKIIAYIYPIEGYFGLLIAVCLIINFTRLSLRRYRKKKALCES